MDFDLVLPGALEAATLPRIDRALITFPVDTADGHATQNRRGDRESRNARLPPPGIVPEAGGYLFAEKHLAVIVEISRLHRGNQLVAAMAHLDVVVIGYIIETTLRTDERPRDTDRLAANGLDRDLELVGRVGVRHLDGAGVSGRRSDGDDHPIAVALDPAFDRLARHPGPYECLERLEYHGHVLAAPLLGTPRALEPVQQGLAETTPHRGTGPLLGGEHRINGGLAEPRVIERQQQLDRSDLTGRKAVAAAIHEVVVIARAETETEPGLQRVDSEHCVAGDRPVLIVGADEEIGHPDPVDVGVSEPMPAQEDVEFPGGVLAGPLQSEHLVHDSLPARSGGTPWRVGIVGAEGDVRLRHALVVDQPFTEALGGDLRARQHRGKRLFETRIRLGRDDQSTNRHGVAPMPNARSRGTGRSPSRRSPSSGT